MQLIKLLDKVKKLENIQKKVNNDRNILLINIMKLTKGLNHYTYKALEIKSEISKLFSEYRFKNNIVDNENIFEKSKFFKKIIKSFYKQKELWIYVTEEQKYATDSYSRYEHKILETIKKKRADFLPIGKRAIEFCKENKLTIIKEYDLWKNNISFMKNISQIIKTFYIEKNYKNVNFVINSNKNYNNHFTILPINKFNVYELLSNKEIEIKNVSFKNTKIFPNINDYLENQIDLFLLNALHSLFIESSFYTAKVGLVTLNKVSNEIDENVAKIKKKVLSTKREIEIEEITMITRNNKLNLIDKNEVNNNEKE
ncbi:Uncharacterised protein [Mycoplasmopsis maculosa]|uniref:ATP synthase gamma chain n=1 Tax=Mycoplasmopsis maculosa TaxID=114885 RepID=A0A449B542_9BACT|nr:hypothetical protein [Mycoplasmopsis maculosa]VEU75721.1 Uncharacterised protein [Mycoplasmopsis maculosa]